METELFLREALIRRQFIHGSGGDRHLLKFVEELKKEDEKKVVCKRCREPAGLGPVFKCTACEFLCHPTCFRRKVPFEFESTITFHFGRRHGQLIFTEELKNDGKEGVVCIACGENVEGSAYKCSAFECKFQLHKSCAQLPRQMHHPLHPSHILRLEYPSQSFSNCNACGKWCSTCLFYYCKECNFNLDITCTTRMRINNADDCQHTFVTFFKHIYLTCEACGQVGTDFASLCTICRLFIHSKCAGFPRTIKITRHHHVLTLIYSLYHRFKDFNNVFCNLCREKVKTEYAAFCCDHQKCGFVAHLYCADAYRHDIVDLESLLETPVDVKEKTNPGEIQHFNHPHNLILSHEEVLHDKLCDGCMHFIISTPFYICMQCNLFFHTTCAQLPKKKKHILHQHRLTLHTSAPFVGGVFTCDACGHSRHGFVYRCVQCHYHLDPRCCSIPETLKHESHQHPLFLAISSHKNCNACDHGYKRSMKRGVFVCTPCDFALGFECAILPLIARHKYDEHQLALTYVAEENSREYYCLICEEERNPKNWFYYCAKCDFPAHLQCVLGKYPYIKFGKTYRSKNHRHPVTLVPKNEYSPPCDACGKTFDGMAVECTQCKFNVHKSPECLQKISVKRSIRNIGRFHI